jgi:dTMP kinase
MKPEHPRLVALEGLDASGKATQARLLADRLMADVVAYPVYDSLSGKALKRMFEQTTWAEADPFVYAAAVQALQTANRLETAHDLWHALALDKRLVLDRFAVSALAYGTSDGLPYGYLLDMMRTLPVPHPEHYVYLDIPVAESFARRPQREDAYEADRDRLERVRERYLNLFREPPELFSWTGRPVVWSIVNACGTVEDVQERIWSCIGSVPSAVP